MVSRSLLPQAASKTRSVLETHAFFMVFPFQKSWRHHAPRRDALASPETGLRFQGRKKALRSAFPQGRSNGLGYAVSKPREQAVSKRLAAYSAATALTRPVFCALIRSSISSRKFL